MTVARTPALQWQLIIGASAWTNFGSGYQIAQYARDEASRLVYVRGLVVWPNSTSPLGSGNPITTLPGGYSPPAHVLYATRVGLASTTDVGGDVYVFSDGRIALMAADGTPAGGNWANTYVSINLPPFSTL